MNKIHYFGLQKQKHYSQRTILIAPVLAASEKPISKAQMILHARRLKDVQTIKTDLQRKLDLILTHALQ